MSMFDCVAPMFVPGDRPERFAKAANSRADAVIIDLEDAVGADSKDAARAALTVAFTHKPVFVRINAVGTRWHDADLVALRQNAFASIILPKAEPSSIAALAATGVTGIIALVETARGMAAAREIASHPAVGRLAFGSIDYCADIGAAHMREALLSARSELVLASRLAGKLAPLDGVTANIDDDAQAESDARYACALGFSGKLCIHPRQIEPVCIGFAPEDAEILWAQRIVASGEGAVALDGEMVDEPVRMRARAVLARIRYSTDTASLIP